MKYCVIGSAAAHHHFPDYFQYKKLRSDIDIIADYDSAIKALELFGRVTSIVPQGSKKLIARYSDRVPAEAEIAWPGTTAERILELQPKGEIFASPEMLLLIKLSHRYLKNSPHFWKTRRHIFLLRELLNQQTVSQELQPLLKDREKETYNYAHPKLNVNKEIFFKDDNIRYIVDHDWIHEQVALFDKPIYKKFAVPGQEVLSSVDKFYHDLSDQERIAAVMEEAMTLAIERSVLPHPGILSYRQAYETALVKIATSITSGWFREFAWENLDEALASFPKSWFEEAVVKVRKKADAVSLPVFL